MNLRLAKYLFVYTTPAIVFFSLYMGGLWSYSALLLLFGLLPFFELFTRGSTQNLSKIEEELAKEDRFYDLILYGLLPVQYLLLGYFLWQAQGSELSLATRIGMISAYGMACGVLGINAAHELGHRSTWYEQFFSKALLLSTLYMHFFIEHNRGHHKHVATEEDPASARYGESLYAFFFRSISKSWLSAWQLEAERLGQEGKAFWSWHNEMLRFQCIQIALVLALFWGFGSLAGLSFLGASFVGILLLETVNYIEHYGLQRKKQGGRYERCLPIHSWNSNHPIGRLLLLELSRHSDHHYIASRKYQVLRHFDDSPQMPTGYPGMMLLALVPPLWFWFMHRHIEQYRLGTKGQALA